MQGLWVRQSKMPRVAATWPNKIIQTEPRERKFTAFLLYAISERVMT